MIKKNSFQVLIFLLMSTMALTNLTGPMADNIAFSLGASISQIGIVQSLFLIVGAFSSLGWAFIGFKRSRRSLLVVATCFWSLFTLVSGLSIEFYSFLTFQVLAAIGYGAIIPLSFSLSLDLVEVERRARSLGFLIAASVFGAGMGIILASFSVDYFSWKSPFIFLGFLGIFTVIFLSFILDPKEIKNRADTTNSSLTVSYRLNVKDLRTIFSVKSNKYLFLLSFMSFVAIGPITYFFVSFLKTDHGFSGNSGIASIMQTAINTTQLFGAPYIGKLADKKNQSSNMGRLKVIQACILIGPLFFFFGYLLIFNPMDVLLVILFLIFLSLGAFFISGIDPLSAATLGDQNSQRTITTVYSFNTITQTLGRSTGIFIVSALLLLNDGFYQGSFIFMSLIFLGCGAILIPLYKTLSLDMTPTKKGRENSNLKIEMYESMYESILKLIEIADLNEYLDLKTKYIVNVEVYKSLKTKKIMIIVKH